MVPEESPIRHLAQELNASPAVRGGVAGLTTFSLGRECGVGRRRALLQAAAVGWIVHEITRSGHALMREIRNTRDGAFLAASTSASPQTVGGWVIEPDFGSLVLWAAVRAETIVEFGSGASTVFVAENLRRRGSGRLISFDHDEEFAERTRSALHESGLDQWVDLRHAPLREQEIEGVQVSWYDREVVVGALEQAGAGVDLVVVDGPPSQTPDSRWPALPVTEAFLASGAELIMDDGRTAHVSGIARRWAEADPSLVSYWHDTVKGAWRLERLAGVPEAEGPEAGIRRALARINPRPAGFGPLFGVRRS